MIKKQAEGVKEAGDIAEREYDDLVGWLKQRRDMFVKLGDLEEQRKTLLDTIEAEYQQRGVDILSTMGMPSAFSATDAELSGMSPDAMRLSYVRQDAVIKVDEEGSEAAAVSSAAVEKNYAAAPGENVVFHADHPFIYLISESSTGAILFAGRYSCKSK